MKRVTVKRSYPTNELLIYFLNEMKEAEAKKNDGSRLQFTYGNALKSLKAYPIEIKETDELKLIKFFGDVLINRLTKKLAEFRKICGEPTEDSVKKIKDGNLPKGTTDGPTVAMDSINPSKNQNQKGSRKKEFIPHTGSGSYAILRALYDDAIFNGGVDNGGLFLEDLRKASDMYSREAMVKNSAVQHYTPFSCLTTLTTKYLIKRKKVGRKDVVTLTDSGFALAEKLSQTDVPKVSEEETCSKNSNNTQSDVLTDNKIKETKRKPRSSSTGGKKVKKAKLTDAKESQKDVDIDLVEDDSATKNLIDEDEIYIITKSLADRLKGKHNSQLKTSTPFNEFDDDQPGPSWKNFARSVNDYEAEIISSQSTSGSDGYVFVTSELTETTLKCEACQETDAELGVEMVWIKTSENYLKSQKDLLYKLSLNEGVFETPYVLAHLFEGHAESLAPGFNKTKSNLKEDKISFAQQKDYCANNLKNNVSEKILTKSNEMLLKETSLLLKHSQEFLIISEEGNNFLDAYSICNDIVLEPNTFDIVLIVDTAEVKGGVPMTGETDINRRDLLSTYLIEQGVLFESRKLNSGDYLWIARKRHCDKPLELVLDVIIERKRLDDLWKSITDGRWSSQKYRLKRCGVRKIMYLFEELPKSTRFPDYVLAALRSAMINAEIQDGFSVEKTAHVKDTADFLTRMTKFLIQNFKSKRLMQRKLPENKEIPESDGVLDLEFNNVNLLSFEEFQKLAGKPRRFTIGETFVMCLMQISGVSLELAKGIGEKFGTFQGLLNALDECGDDEKAKLKLLEDIKSGLHGKRLGPLKAKKIVDFFNKSEIDD